jgi:hypothetical protein
MATLPSLFRSMLLHVRLAYQPPASSTFISEQTSHQQPASITFFLRTNQHRLSATSQTNKLHDSCLLHVGTRAVELLRSLSVWELAST